MKDFLVRYEDGIAKLQSSNKAFEKVFDFGSMHIEIFKPIDIDTQEPHDQDEIYIIASGFGKFILEETTIEFKPGDVIFVPAHKKHKFINFSKDFTTWVVFLDTKGSVAQPNQATKVLTLLEHLDGIVKTGLNYSDSPYDLDRYTTMQKLLEELNPLLVNFNTCEPLFKLRTEGNYITPPIAVIGIIINRERKILLEQRKDDGCWGLPGGWCETGLSIEENIIKEFKEETGYDVQIDRLVKIMSRLPDRRFPFTSYYAIYELKIVGGSLTVSFESEDVAWLDPSEVTNWHWDHKDWVYDFLSNT